VNEILSSSSSAGSDHSCTSDHDDKNTSLATKATEPEKPVE
jgi:hypothetical protein